MRCDYHVHSSISADSSTSTLEQIKQAEALGLDEICFTEHLEIHFYRGKNGILTYRIIKSDSPN